MYGIISTDLQNPNAWVLATDYKSLQPTGYDKARALELAKFLADTYPGTLAGIVPLPFTD